MTTTIVFISCPSHNGGQGKVSVYYRYNATLMKEYKGSSKGSFYGNQLNVIERESGTHVFAVFTSLSSSGTPRIEIIEVLVDITKTADD